MRQWMTTLHTIDDNMRIRLHFLVAYFAFASVLSYRQESNVLRPGKSKSGHPTLVKRFRSHILIHWPHKLADLFAHKSGPKRKFRRRKIGIWSLARQMQFSVMRTRDSRREWARKVRGEWRRNVLQWTLQIKLGRR